MARKVARWLVGLQCCGGGLTSGCKRRIRSLVSRPGPARQDHAPTLEQAPSTRCSTARTRGCSEEMRASARRALRPLTSRHRKSPACGRGGAAPASLPAVAAGGRGRPRARSQACSRRFARGAGGTRPRAGDDLRADVEQAGPNFLGSAPAELPSSRPHIQIAAVSSGGQDRPTWAAEGLVLTAASTAARSTGTGRSRRVSTSHRTTWPTRHQCA